MFQCVEIRGQTHVPFLRCHPSLFFETGPVSLSQRLHLPVHHAWLLTQALCVCIDWTQGLDSGPGTCVAGASLTAPSQQHPDIRTLRPLHFLNTHPLCCFLHSRPVCPALLRTVIKLGSGQVCPPSSPELIPLARGRSPCPML